ncbi:unnamed protein product [Brassica oleracea]
MHSLLQQLGVDIVRKESIREPGKRQFLVDVDDISDVITDNAVRPCSFAHPGDPSGRRCKSMFVFKTHISIKTHFSVKPVKSYFSTKTEKRIFPSKPKNTFSRQTKKKRIFPRKPKKMHIPAKTPKSIFRPKPQKTFSRQNWKNAIFPPKPEKHNFSPKPENTIFPQKPENRIFPPKPENVTALGLLSIESLALYVLSQLRHLAMFRCWKLDNVSLSRISKMVGVSCMHITRGDKDTSRYVEVNIRWFSDFLNQWTLQTDMLQICLPETVYISPLSLFFIRNDFKTIPDYIKQLPQLKQLSLYECRSLVSLPQPQDSLSSLDAENCVSLETIDGSFHNPDIRLNFLNCVKLNHEARELIQTSVCKHALLPAGEVSGHFIHRATGGSITIHLKERHLPMFLKFKACLLMIDDEGDVDEEDDDYDEEVIVYGDYDT